MTVVEDAATTTVEVTLNVIEEVDETAAQTTTDSEASDAPLVTTDRESVSAVAESEPAAPVEQNAPEQEQTTQE